MLKKFWNMATGLWKKYREEGKKMKFTEKGVSIYCKQHPLILIIKLFIRIKPNQFPVFPRTPKVHQNKACGDEYMLLMC